MGDQKWSVTASFAQYVAALNSSLGDSASAGGNPQTFRYTYGGPSINADPAQPRWYPPTRRSSRSSNWYFANGGSSLPLRSQPDIPGVTPQIRGNLASPNVIEYATGVNRQVGGRATLRADYVYRNYRDFYSQRIDTTTGKVTNSLGQTFRPGTEREHGRT